MDHHDKKTIKVSLYIYIFLGIVPIASSIYSTLKGQEKDITTFFYAFIKAIQENYVISICAFAIPFIILHIIKILDECKNISKYTKLVHQDNETFIKSFKSLKSDLTEEYFRRLASLVISYNGNKDYSENSLYFINKIIEDEKSKGKTIYIISNYMFNSGKSRMDEDRKIVIKKTSELIVKRNLNVKIIISANAKVFKKIENLPKYIADEINARISHIPLDKYLKSIDIRICEQLYIDLLLIEGYVFMHFNDTRDDVQRNGILIQDRDSYNNFESRIVLTWEKSKENHSGWASSIHHYIDDKYKDICKFT